MGTTGNQASYQTKLDGFASGINALLGVPATPTACDAARLKCIGKFVAGSLACVSKTAGKLGGTAEAACLAKHVAKFTDESKPGCYDKATAACSNGTTADTAQAQADVFISGAACNLLPGSTPCAPVCGNAFIDPGEPCDGSTAPDMGACGVDFSCTACNCACPTQLHFAADASAAETMLDQGWTGVGHRMPVTSNGDVTLGVSCGAATRPCGTCTLSGPIANPGATELRNRRCLGDTSVQCTNNADCVVPGGTCEFFFPGVSCRSRPVASSSV